jgi:paraquat-inducible protein B
MTPAKPVLVGSFILGALALGVVAILAFGGLNLFAKSLRLVVVFKDSVAGLEVGASRGPVGQEVIVPTYRRQ